MNFIKKKLKSHKKDDEEEEYEKAVYEQSLQPQDQKMKNTEEWQFFQQLSMKVQDTVQKTQTTLNKLKDIRQDSVLGKDNVFDTGEESASLDFGSDGNLPYGNSTSKFPSAPPRPPPPAADKPLSATESGMDAILTQGSSMRAPPRPPPPIPGMDMNIFTDNDLQGLPIKSSPARPPSPMSTKHFPASAMKDLSHHDSSCKVDASIPGEAFSLLDDFKFQSSEPILQTGKANFQDLLFLDVKEDTDPFDTSFVDVTNITSHYECESKDGNLSDAVSNPFSCNSDFEKNIDENVLPDSKRNLTNPFFSASESNEYTDSISNRNDMVWSIHNPFNITNVETVTHNEDILTQKFTENEPIDLFETFDKNVDSITDPVIQSTSIKHEAAGEFNLTEDINILTIDDAFIVPDHGSHYQAEDILFFPDEEKIPEPAQISEQNNITEAFDYNIASESTSIVWDTQPVTVEDDASFDLKIAAEDHVTAEETVAQDLFGEEVSSSATVDADKFLTSNSAEPFDSSLNQDAFSTEGESVLDIALPADDENHEGNESKIENAVNESSGSFHNITSEKPSVTLGEVTDIGQTVPCISEVEKPTLDNNSDITHFEESNNSFAFSFQMTSEQKHEFDDFSAKFENAKDNSSDKLYDPFSGGKHPSLKKIQDDGFGFGSMDEFDPFKVGSKGAKSLQKESSKDSFEEYDNEADFSIVIKPKMKDNSTVQLLSSEPPKLLPPPPKTPTKAFDNNALRFNPFDKDFAPNSSQANTVADRSLVLEIEDEPIPALGEAAVRKSESVETPLSPLFDEDTSMPLEPFPLPYPNEGWEMVLRQPNKKKLTGNRFWKKIFVKLSENSVLQLYNKNDDKLPFQELPLQACYSLSEIGAQQYDQYGKIFTVKLQYKFYRERVGVRPGQISKVTQGQISSMGDVAKLGLPLQHAPQTSQLLKIGTHSYPDIKFFIQEIEDAFFRMVVHRDRVLTYKTEEVQVIAQDEFCVEQSKTGFVEKQLARVRILFLAFITGMPSVEVGLNDINRQGKEVVGRYDIIPVVTEEWIRLEDCEFHSCINQEEFKKSRIIKFQPPDACLFELLRFRIRPPKNRELPLQVRVFMTVSSSRVEIRSDILVPGYSSRKQGQVPCENIQIRFPIPECWIYLFRTEKHFRYGSKKSTARRPGKIKGLERIIGAAQNLDPSLIEVSAGQAKYEHVFHAVVWRIPRLPKEGQGAYTQQLFLLRTELTAFDQIPEAYEPYVHVEFTMPATYVSHTTVRSVSVSNPSPPEKYVRYVSKHEYKVEIEFKSPDDIEGLVSSPSVNVPVTTTNIQESTEDEKEDNSD